jgi:hypothetical protein
MQGPDNPQDAAVGQFQPKGAVCKLLALIIDPSSDLIQSFGLKSTKVPQYLNGSQKFKKGPANHEINVIVYLHTHHAPAAVSVRDADGHVVPGNRMPITIEGFKGHEFGNLYMQLVCRCNLAFSPAYRLIIATEKAAGAHRQQ